MKKIFICVLIVVMAIMMVGCGSGVEDYIGTWTVYQMGDSNHVLDLQEIIMGAEAWMTVNRDGTYEFLLDLNSHTTSLTGTYTYKDGVLELEGDYTGRCEKTHNGIVVEVYDVDDVPGGIVKYYCR